MNDRSPIPALLALAFATFTTVTAEMIPAGLLPGMTREFEVSPARIGLLVSVWAFTVAATSLVLVRLTARIEQRTLMIAALALLAAANVATATAPTYAIALVSRVGAAAVHGLFWSIVMAYTSRLVAPSQLGRAAAVVLAGPTIAGVVGIPLGTMAGNAIDWRVTFWAVAGLMGLTGVTLWRLLPRVPVAGREGGRPGGWDASARPVLLLALVGATVLVGHFVLYTYIAPVLTGLGGFATSSVGPVLLLYGLGGVAGVGVAGTVADRWPGRSLAWTVAVFVASTAGVALIGRDRVIGIVAIVLWGTAIAVLPVLVQTAMLRAASEQFRATAGAVLVTAMNTGVAAGALLGGVVLEAQGPVALVLSASLISAIGLLLLGVRAVATARSCPARPTHSLRGTEPDCRVGG
ncbi:MFS transporter [Segeticoccus rhizosphaerae]|jgi:predicted MFS family arabinose efflux permease|uniref:MFS transporter n=1 Tax=Segeticoccus rhizosphaerae TaxID=1104777 RepID=UPI0012643F38|nr:MFS transporter [Segeticoccus rhizosphaerae]